MAAQGNSIGYAGLCIAGLLLAVPAAAQFALPTNSAGRTSASACLAINSLVLPELASVAAQWLDAGPSPLVEGGDAPLPALAAHCRISATVAPAIRIEVWLPASGTWNGRFLGLGGTSAGGALNYVGMAAALNAGYATASTDDGHGSEDLAWLGNERQLRDFAYRAIYEMTAQARIFLADFYGRPENYRYFNGCALGGRQGLMEAERFPGDYDGIVAGFPAPGFVDAAVLRVWLQAMTEPLPGRPALRPDTLALAHGEVMAQCDAADGASDGTIADPRRCAFEPASLQCGSTSGGGRCLAPAEVAGLRQIYAGPPEPAIGVPASVSGFVPALDMPGLAIGSERDLSLAADSGLDRFTLEFFRHVVFMDPGWTWQSFDFEAGTTGARAVAGWLDVPAADLGSFRNRGGKLIVYQGWNDVSSSPEATIAWYQAVAAATAGYAGNAAGGIDDFARLFMVPGMAQCGGEAMTAELQGAVEAWVERGVAPDRIATAMGDGETSDPTRALCPYPQRAVSGGTGIRARSESFVCAN